MFSRFLTCAGNTMTAKSCSSKKKNCKTADLDKFTEQLDSFETLMANDKVRTSPVIKWNFSAFHLQFSFAITENKEIIDL